MVDAERETASAHSPHAEQLHIAMGWDKLPEMTAEERAKFEEDNRGAAQERARRFYGLDAAG